MTKTILTATEINELRLAVLENSLLVEAQITDFLAIALNLDKNRSLTLGDSSSALSLKTKIDLLIDLGMLDKEEKKKLMFYLEIRNKFLHNWHCRSFVDCFKSLEGTGKYLKKTYVPKDFVDEESEFAFCYNCLGREIIQITMDTLTKVSQHRAQSEVAEKLVKLYTDFRSRNMAYLYELQHHPIFEKYNISEDDRQTFWDHYKTELEQFKNEI